MSPMIRSRVVFSSGNAINNTASVASGVMALISPGDDRRHVGLAEGEERERDG